MKKNLNKILLEAIHRGIKLALDDFDDELVGQQTLTIKNQNVTKDYLELLDYVVDLGLPSGTLWCKYNLGCDFEKLNKEPENTIYLDWYGDHYAWGELEPHKDEDIHPYNWIEYKYTEGNSNNTFTKYCDDSQYGLGGYTDNLTRLLPKDDAAYQNIHINKFKFHIPTKKLFEELKKYTTIRWLLNYIVNRKEIINAGGMELTSIINGNKLFIPAAGYYSNSNLEYENNNGYYWTSDLINKEPICAHTTHLRPHGIYLDYNVRCVGYSIRPVINL